MKYGKTIVTIAEFQVDEILPLAGKDAPPRTFTVNGVDYLVKMDSMRYRTFKRSRDCECCGLEGAIMLLQAFPDQPVKSAHFNLWGFDDDGTPVMLTKDHIRPASEGGFAVDNNLRTLCQKCNMVRGTRDITMDELKKETETWVSSKQARKERRILGRWKRRLMRARKLGKLPPKIESDKELNT